MNKELWNLIVDFDLDRPLSEYGFSTRLANENRWPVGFTEEAILEYKKFMFLAATTQSMVSPSEIVDIVWHQHLIFTKSYEAFCQILGKKIEHIPSTHNREEEDKFELARKHTKEQYEINFGEQPKAFWEYCNLYSPLKFKKSGINTQTVVWLGLLSMLVGFIFAFPTLSRFVVKIDNPWFLVNYMLIFGIALIFLNALNKMLVRMYLKGVDENAFIFKLDPTELIYMKREKIDDLVHISINKFIKSKQIKIHGDLKLGVEEDFECQNAREWVVKDFIQLLIKVHYFVVVARMRPKAPFQNVKTFVDALREKFMESKLFTWIFSINFTVFAIIFTFGLTRILTGISRNKSLGILIFVVLLTMIAMVFFLYHIKNTLTKRVIPNFHKRQVENLPENHNTGEWKYFMHGQATLSAMLIPLIVYELPTQNSGGGSGGGCGSGGSSCGSSCGGGCGGCGGD